MNNLETDLLPDKDTLNLHTRDIRESEKIFRDLVIEIEHSHKKQSDSSFQKTLRRASATIDSRVAYTPKNSKRKHASDSPEVVPAPNIPYYQYTAPTTNYSFGQNTPQTTPTPPQTTPTPPHQLLPANQHQATHML